MNLCLCLPTGAGLAFDKDAARNGPSGCLVFNFLSLLQHSFIHPPHPLWDKPWTLEGNSEVSLWPRRHTFILLLTSEAIAVKMGKMTTSHTVEHILSFFCFLCVVICLGVASIHKYIWCGQTFVTSQKTAQLEELEVGLGRKMREGLRFPGHSFTNLGFLKLLAIDSILLKALWGSPCWRCEEEESSPVPKLQETYEWPHCFASLWPVSHSEVWDWVKGPGRSACQKNTSVSLTGNCED